jgi:hypothetical protein
MLQLQLQLLCVVDCVEWLQARPAWGFAKTILWGPWKFHVDGCREAAAAHFKRPGALLQTYRVGAVH